MTQAAIYCRSSKDRAEVGLAAQRAELKAFAKTKGLSIAAECQCQSETPHLGQSKNSPPPY
jgi:DNA invertase Pin-like site-specific DNA recombinase